LSLVVVDYLQLFKTTARKDRNREQEVAEVSRALKAMAGTLKCPVLALAQLSRESEKQGRRPRPSDLRDSGQVEQDADGILFLHRDKETPRGCVDVIIAKQRQGQVGTFALAWWPRYMRFDGHMDAVSGAVQGVA
jgi:replicative DNA helicase